MLDDDEAVALAVSLRVAGLGAVDGIEESALRALGKLDQVMPARLRRRVGALRTSIEAAGAGAPRVDPELIVALSAACRDHEDLRFRYRSGAGDRFGRARTLRLDGAEG